MNKTPALTYHFYKKNPLVLEFSQNPWEVSINPFLALCNFPSYIRKRLEMLQNSNCSKPNIHVVAESSEIINYPNLGRNVETVGDRRWGGGEQGAETVLGG